MLWSSDELMKTPIVHVETHDRATDARSRGSGHRTFVAEQGHMNWSPLLVNLVAAACAANLKRAGSGGGRAD
jgi:hypothetical protein